MLNNDFIIEAIATRIDAYLEKNEPVVAIMGARSGKGRVRRLVRKAYPISMNVQRCTYADDEDGSPAEYSFSPPLGSGRATYELSAQQILNNEYTMPEVPDLVVFMDGACGWGVDGHRLYEYYLGLGYRVVVLSTQSDDMSFWSDKVSFGINTWDVNDSVSLDAARLNGAKMAEYNRTYGAYPTLDESIAHGIAHLMPDVVYSDPKFYESMDAQVWAKALSELMAQRPGIVDESLMLGWFSNAIQRGYDTGHTEGFAKAQASE